MTYDEQVETAIAANDIEALVRFAYGVPCKCTKIKGEPLCVCEMQSRALRAKVVPLPLFSGKIQRVETASTSTPESSNPLRSIFAFFRK